MWQKTIAIGSGIGLGLFTMLIGGVILFNLFPFPDNLNWLELNDRNSYLMTLPSRGLKLIILYHGIGCFVAGLIAALISKKQRMALGLISFSACYIYILNDLWFMKYPEWFYYFDIFIAFLSGLIGALIGSRFNK